MTGHCLAASGSIECVASVIQLKDNFLFPSINCEDLHPEISALISERKVVRETKEIAVDILLKSSFGFGDVNGVLVFKRWSGH